MSRKISYLLENSSQYVCENTGTSITRGSEIEKTNLFVSFRAMEEEKLKLIKSCPAVQADPSIRDMTIENSIYLDTITNKTLHKKQTKFLLAPILPKLHERGIEYIALSPSILEFYTKKYPHPQYKNVLGDEFEKDGYDKDKFMERMLKQRHDLATKVYEPVGFKSYVPCPGYLDDLMFSYYKSEYPGLTINHSFEYLQLLNNKTGEDFIIQIPSHYWMIAKLSDIYKKLLKECLTARVEKFKELGSSITELDGESDEINGVIEQIKKLIDESTIDNFRESYGQIKRILDERLKTKLISSGIIDADFIKDMELLLDIGGQLESDEITQDGLTTCLSMIKEAEDKEEWIMRGGSITGFYLNKLNHENREINKYKKLYQKYKIKYLASKKL